MTATQQRPDWWRDEFRSLDGLPLLPCGAGESKKAPFPTGWQTLSFSLDDVMTYSGVRCIGMRCGPDAGGILVVDYDGLSAIQLAAENFPSDPNDPGSWIIGRENNPNRYKEAFYVPQDRWDRCVGKTVWKTDEAKKEQLEFFFSSGQVIVAGQHVSSGGEYCWLNGSPDEIRPVPDSVWEMYQASIARGQTAPGKFVARRSREENNGWRDNVPCEICGRTDNYCRISNDGDAILCHKGNRWRPPVLAVGETIERNSGVWAYVGDRANQHGPGMGALFRREDPQRQLRRHTDESDSIAMASRWNYLDWEEIKSAYPEYASYGPKPSLDSIVVEFLKQYEVYVKPASTAETPGGRDRASSAFFGAVSGATGNFDIAADAAIISNQRKGAAIQEWTQWKQWALDHSAFEAFRTSRLEDWEKLRARVESDEFAAEWEAQKGQRKIQEQEARLEMAWLEKGLIAFLALTFAALFSWMMVEKIQDLRSIPDIRGTSTK